MEKKAVERRKLRFAKNESTKFILDRAAVNFLDTTLCVLIREFLLSSPSQITLPGVILIR